MKKLPCCKSCKYSCLFSYRLYHLKKFFKHDEKSLSYLLKSQTKFIRKNSKVKNLYLFKLISNSMEKIDVQTENIEINEDKANIGNTETKDKKDSKSKLNKMNKKIAKAINSIIFHEQTEPNTLFSKQQTDNFLIYHHGNGDEEDFSLISNFLSQYGVKFTLNIFPGISYGFIKIDNQENFFKYCTVYKILTDLNIFVYTVQHKYTNEEKERPIFFFPTLNTLDNIKLFKVSQIQIAHLEQSNEYNVPGLIILDNFISEEEEKVLVEEIEKNEWNKLSHRQVQHYGYEFLYGKNTINKKNKIGDLPVFCNSILSKFTGVLKEFTLDHDRTKQYQAEFYNYKTENQQSVCFLEKNGMFDQLTINKYSSGEGIPPHVDTHSPFNDIYCSISLLSGVVMTFTKENLSRSIYLKPRSAAFFTNELRYEWEHSIALRKVDLIENSIKSRSKRISLTFRKIRYEDECKCVFTKQCDTYKQNNSTSTTIKISQEILESDVPTEIEKKLVYEVYEKIAPHFSHTRYKPWPKVVEFLSSLPKFSVVGDVGCGNGKYLSSVQDLITIGTDRSFNLSKIAFDKNPKSNLFVADSLELPLKDNCLDAAISIAVIHHFSNDKMRLKAIKEIKRCVKVGGSFLIYVWALEQEDGKFKDQDNLVAWHLQDTYADKTGTSVKNEKIGNMNLSNKDEVIDSNGFEVKEKQSVVYHRYYHVFKEGELECLIGQVEGIEITKKYYDHENWCCICKKLF